LAGAATTDSSDIIRVIEEVDENGCTNGDCTEGQTLDTKIDPIWTKEDLPKLKYNPEKNHGTLVVILRKEEEGFWQDLDLLGRLQQPTQRQQVKQQSQPKKTTKSPLIEVVNAKDDELEEHNEYLNLETADAMDDLLSVDKKKCPTYGLFQLFSNVFRDYAREGLAHDMLESPNPDESYGPVDVDDTEENINGGSEKQLRRAMRLETEKGKFDSDRYLNDFCVEEEGDMIFDSAMMMVPHWLETKNVPYTSDKSVENITNGLSKLSTFDGKGSGQNHQSTTSFFTSEESHLLATLPPQNSIPGQPTIDQKRSAFMTLIDILFAYAYDHRTTDGDPTVESSWTVMILSPSLAWLESYNPPYDTIADVVRWSIRRSLVYPYLRSYTLARNVVGDVCQIMKGGRRTILRCLLQLHRIMEKSESHYLFNKLYVDPLIGWVQRCEEREVQGFEEEMRGVMMHTSLCNSSVAGVKDAETDLVGKNSLGLGLLELEKTFFEYDGDEDSTSSSEKDDDDSSVDDDNDSDSHGVDEDEDTVGMTNEEELHARNGNKEKEATLDA